MRKGLLVFLLCFFYATAYSQDEWAKVGTKWYYSNFEGWTEGIKEGYVLLESLKDTVVSDTLCKKITVKTYYSTTGAISEDTPILTKKNLKKYLYKSLQESSWHLLFDSSWNEGIKYSIELFDLDKYKNFAFTFVGFKNEIVNGENFVFANLQFDDFIYFHDINGHIKFNTKVGFTEYFILKPNYKAVDGFSAGPLRCFKNEIKTINFGSVKCDSITNEKVAYPPKPNSIIKNRSSFYEVYPNPFNDFIDINFLQSSRPSNIILFDAIGNIIYLPVDISGSVDTRKLQKGIYLLKLQNENGITLKKIIKNE